MHIHFSIFSENTVNNALIFYNLIYDKKFKSDLMLASPGGAGRNRVLKKSEFLDIERTVPKQIEEQTAIGNFFKQLDAAIASHQRKA